MAWTDLLATILAPTGIVAMIIKMMTVWIARKRAARLTSGYASIEELFIIIQQLLQVTSAIRVLVFKSENGGGVPGPGCVVRNSVIHESNDCKHKRIMPIWQNIELDQTYSRLISEICTKGESDLLVKDVPPQSLLADLMNVSDVGYMRCIRICATSKWLVYLAVCYTASTDVAPYHRLEILRVVTRLRTIFRQHHSLVRMNAEAE